MNISEFKQKYPVYKNIPDTVLAQALWEKYYKKEVTFEKFAELFGVQLPPKVEDLSSVNDLAGAPLNTTPAGQTPPLLNIDFGSVTQPSRSRANYVAQQEQGRPSEQVKGSLPSFSLQDFLKEVGNSAKQYYASWEKGYAELVQGYGTVMKMVGMKAAGKSIEKLGKQSVQYWQSWISQNPNPVQRIGNMIFENMPTLKAIGFAGGFGGAVGKALLRLSPVLSSVVGEGTAGMLGRAVTQGSIFASLNASDLQEKIMNAPPHDLLQYADAKALYEKYAKHMPALDAYKKMQEVYADAAVRKSYAINEVVQSVMMMPLGKLGVFGELSKSPVFQYAKQKVIQTLAKHVVLSATARVGETAGAAGVFSAVNQALSNVDERMYVNKERDLSGGIEDAFVGGAIAGALFGLMGEGVGAIVRNKLREEMGKNVGKARRTGSNVKSLPEGTTPTDIQGMGKEGNIKPVGKGPGGNGVVGVTGPGEGGSGGLEGVGNGSPRIHPTPGVGVEGEGEGTILPKGGKEQIGERKVYKLVDNGISEIKKPKLYDYKGIKIAIGREGNKYIPYSAQLGKPFIGCEGKTVRDVLLNVIKVINEEDGSVEELIKRKKVEIPSEYASYFSDEYLSKSNFKNIESEDLIDKNVKELYLYNRLDKFAVPLNRYITGKPTLYNCDGNKVIVGKVKKGNWIVVFADGGGKVGVGSSSKQALKSALNYFIYHSEEVRKYKEMVTRDMPNKVRPYFSDEYLSQFEFKPIDIDWYKVTGNIRLLSEKQSEPEKPTGEGETPKKPEKGKVYGVAREGKTFELESPKFYDYKGIKIVLHKKGKQWEATSAETGYSLSVSAKTIGEILGKAIGKINENGGVEKVKELIGEVRKKHPQELIPFFADEHLSQFTFKSVEIKDGEVIIEKASKTKKPPKVEPEQPAEQPTEVEVTPKEKPVEEVEKPKQEEYFVPEEPNWAGKGKKTRARDNIRAIELIKQGKESYTPEEKREIAKYIGWGGLKEVFDPRNKTFEPERKRLKELLTKEEYDNAEASILNAHYTSPKIVRKIWDIVHKVGFKGGKVLEPGVGTGNFIGYMPKELRSKVKVSGIEHDPITAQIAKVLYPEHQILSADYRKIKPAPMFDLAIGNPPFSDLKVTKNKKKYNLHSFFVVHSLDMLRPHKMLAVVVSHHFLDNMSLNVREYLVKHADFLGAVRLPNTTFEKNAGTKVTTDIVFFKKLDTDEGEHPTGSMAYLQRGEVNGVPINKYFEEHPENLLGEWKLGHGLYKANEPILEPAPDINIDERINKFVDEIKDRMSGAGDIPEVDNSTVEEVDADGMIPKPEDYVYRVRKGKIYFNNKEVNLPKNRVGRLKGMIELAQLTNMLFDKQVNPNIPDTEIEHMRSMLKEKYEEFVGKYSQLNNPFNKRIFRDDARFFKLMSLEEMEDDGFVPAPILLKRTVYPYKSPEKVDNIEDGLIVSLQDKGEVDLDYISKLSGKSKDEVIKALEGKHIFYNPDNQKYEFAYDYLRGDIKEKYKKAVEANLSQNAAFLRQHFPPYVLAGDIKTPLGSVWIPENYYNEFLKQEYAGNIIIKRLPSGGWSVNTVNSEWYYTDSPLYPQLEHKAIKLQKFLSDVLNGRELKVKRTIEEGGKKKSIIDIDATTQLKAIASQLKWDWENWLWENDDRVRDLTELYNQKINVYASDLDSVLPEIVYQHLSDDVKPYKHQKAASTKILMSGGPYLLYHEVGTGKTITAILSIMKMLETGKAKKVLIAVPKSVVGQWIKDFAKTYPNAKILSPSGKDFSKNNRKRFISRIIGGDHQVVILSHEQLTKIENNPDVEKEALEEQLNAVRASEDIAQSNNDKRTFSTLVRREESLRAKIDELSEIERDKIVPFDKLGIDMLIVDEAHRFKNLTITTALHDIKGLRSGKASKRAWDLYVKILTTYKRTGGKNVLFLTGTPVTNTLAEIYVMQRYMQPEKLKALDIHSFDDWVSMFGEIKTTPELNTVGKWKMVSRLSAIKNLHVLKKMFLQNADVLTGEQFDKNMEKEGRKSGKPPVETRVIIVEPTPEQEELMGKPDENGNYPEGSIIYRFEHLSGKPEKGGDNALKIFIDGKKLSTDARGLMPNAPDRPNSKFNTIINNIHRIWERTKKIKGTQIVFLDLFVPKKDLDKQQKEIHELIDKANKGDLSAQEELDKIPPDEWEALTHTQWDAYEEMKEKLIKKGVPQDEIAFIHDANTEDQKKTLFDKVNKGKVRIILGSTSKLGEGVNIQQRLVALHHVDVPWTPAGLKQREGRIVRQGNWLYKLGLIQYVEIYRYGAKRTGDAILWQFIANKARLIEQFIYGDANEIKDEGMESITSEEIKARVSGNPAVYRAFVLNKDLESLRQEKRVFERNKRNAKNQLGVVNELIQRDKERRANFEADIKNADKLLVEIKDKKAYIEVDGKKYVGKDMVQIMDFLVKKHAGDYQISNVPQVIAKLGDNFELVWKRVALEFQDWGIKGHEIYWISVKPADLNAAGMLIRIKNKLLKIRSIYGYYKQDYDSKMAVLDKIKRQAEATFNKDEEIKEKEKEYNQLIASNLKGKKSHEVTASGETQLRRVTKVLTPGAHNPLVLSEKEKDNNSDINIGLDSVIIDNKEIKIPEDKVITPGYIEMIVKKMVGERVYKGKIRIKNVGGFYRGGEIRYKTYGDVDSLIHETGHWLEAFFKDFVKNNKEELIDFSYDINMEKPEKEGFAEFFRAWCMYYNKTKQDAPTLVRAFENRLRELDPKLKKRIYKLQEAATQWVYQGTIKRGLAKIGETHITKKDEWDYFLLRKPPAMLWTKVMDSLFGIMAIENMLGIEGVKAYKWFRQAVGHWSGLYEGIVERGVPIYREGEGFILPKENKGLRWVFEPLKDYNTKVAYEYTSLYFAAKQALDMKQKGQKIYITDKEISDALQLAKRYPEIEEVYNRYQEFNQNFLGLLVQLHAITPDMKEAFIKSRPFGYAPMNRIIEGMSNESGAGIYRRYGSETHKVKNVIDNIMNNTAHLVRYASLMEGKRILYTEIKEYGGGQFAVEISPDSKVYKVAVDQMADKLAMLLGEMGLKVENGEIVPTDESTEKVNLDEIKQYLIDHPETLEFWTGGHKPKHLGYYIDMFYDDNYKPVWMEVNNEGYGAVLIESLKSLYQARIDNFMLRIGRGVKGVVTRTIVLMPQFLIANIVRDTQMALVRGQAVGNPIKGVAHVIKRNNAFYEMLINLGGYGTILEESGFGKDVAYMLNMKKDVLSKIKRWVHDFDRVMSSSEYANRIAVYEALRKKGVTPLEAGYHAADVTVDFSVKGSDPVLNSFLSTIAFARAGINGIRTILEDYFRYQEHVSVRNFLRFDSAKIRIMTLGFLTLTLPSLIMWWLNKDNKRYQDLTVDQKMRFNYVYFGKGGVIKYTVPYEIGLLYGKIPELFINEFYTRGKKTDKGWGNVVESIWWTIANLYAPNFIPSIMQPFIDITRNKDFKGDNIVPEGLLHVKPEYQYSYYTPEIWVEAGKYFHVSPRLMQYVADSWLGYVMRTIEYGTDALLWDKKKFGEYPWGGERFARAFVEGKVPYRTFYTQHFWLLKQALDQERATLLLLQKKVLYGKKTLDRERLKGELSNLNITMANIAPVVDRVAKLLRALQIKALQITTDKSLSANEKRDQIFSLYKQKNAFIKKMYLQIHQKLSEVKNRLKKLEVK